MIPSNESFNIKVVEANRELSVMCDKEKLLFHFNNSNLHLNRNEKLGKNFVNFNRNNYTWLPKTKKKQISIDIGVYSTSSIFIEKSENEY